MLCEPQNSSNMVIVMNMVMMLIVMMANKYSTRKRHCSILHARFMRGSCAVHARFMRGMGRWKGGKVIGSPGCCKYHSSCYSCYRY